MTFSVVARFAGTGMFGAAISSSSPAIAARCASARAGVGAVASQNILDPRLGEAGLDLLARGASAAETIAILRRTGPYRLSPSPGGRWDGRHGGAFGAERFGLVGRGAGSGCRLWRQSVGKLPRPASDGGCLRHHIRRSGRSADRSHAGRACRPAGRPVQSILLA